MQVRSLQETGKLRQFYEAFSKASDKDPTGYETLVKVLGHPNMNEFQKSWESWVSKLVYPQER